MSIEATIIAYLQQALEVPTCAELPGDYRGGARCVVERLGGGQTEKLDSALLAVQSYAPSLREAAALSGRVCQAMLDAVTLDAIAKVTKNSEYNYTDEAGGRYRYQAVFDLVYYDD